MATHIGIAHIFRNESVVSVHVEICRDASEFGDDKEKTVAPQYCLQHQQKPC